MVSTIEVRGLNFDSMFSEDIKIGHSKRKRGKIVNREMVNGSSMYSRDD